MTNLFLKRKQKKFGAATLIFAVILILLCTLIIIFAANFGRLQEQTVANQTRNAEAFHAAEAGQEYAINYLKQNSATVTGSPSGGYINYTNGSLTNVTLTNGSKFSIVYTNPTANKYDLLEITSTGSNSDNSATRIIKQQVQFGSLLSSPPNSSLTTKGNVTLSGNGTIINTAANNTVQAGGTVSRSGSAVFTTSSGTYTSPTDPNAGVSQSVSSLSSQTNDVFFSNYFGTTNMDSVAAQFTNVYNNSSDTNYSSTLNGLTGKSIWINQTGGTASISANTTIGSLANPVMMVVQGPFSISGNVTIYGFIFVIGPSGITTLTGNINIIGGLVTTDDLTFSGNSSLAFNQAVLNNLKNNPGMSYYAKVAGSWKDF